MDGPPFPDAARLPPFLDATLPPSLSLSLRPHSPPPLAHPPARAPLVFGLTVRQEKDHTRDGEDVEDEEQKESNVTNRLDTYGLVAQGLGIAHMTL